MSAPPKSDVPIITPNELVEADAFVFWVPDKVWNDGSPIQSLSGCDWRPVENLATCREARWHLLQHRLAEITQLVHHGMIFVPIGYTFGADMFEKEKEKAEALMVLGLLLWTVHASHLSMKTSRRFTRESTLPPLPTNSRKLLDLS
ncbi:Probable NAD(P)H dehydrogenase (quinone) FQR1-like 1 [Striga hermonthica]|uniref:Probable NAD(P)H dehydrogenase (Quinone) FQR1-like 1 n=1 Tax=Striga hermonthica TaxID=68872 RepID=A0A9N7MTK2_STRHE|nr:Probable NAD(P)H dehydrogenase (quinone) FQR1-like 1 [Striga hermonthica]